MTMTVDPVRSVQVVNDLNPSEVLQQVKNAASQAEEKLKRLRPNLNPEVCSFEPFMAAFTANVCLSIMIIMRLHFIASNDTSLWVSSCIDGKL